MSVVVLLPQIRLVQVRVRVFGSVGVGVVVVVLDMFVLVAGVRVRVSSFVVAVFVGMRFVVTVLIVCHCRLLWCEIPSVFIVLSGMSPGNKADRVDSRHPVWSAFPRGARGVEQCAWPSGARLRDSAVISRA
jgi:hypothetical protein